MKKIFALIVPFVPIVGCFNGCNKINNGEVKYSALLGSWGTEDGDMLLTFGRASDKNTYSGVLSYYENGKLTEDNFTYTLNYDKTTKLNTLCTTVDDYSETYEIELKEDVLSLIIYSEETATKEETVFIKGKQLVEPENTSNSSELKATTVTS